MSSRTADMKNPGVIFPKAGEVEFQDRGEQVIGPGDVLVRARRTMISAGTELTILSGQFPKKSAWAAYGQFPFLAGYSAAAEVVKVGGQVASLSVGDLVAAPTPHVRYAAVPAGEVTLVRDGRVGLDQLPFVTLAQIVMNGVRRARLQWGEAVVVFGLGILGQLAARFCRLAGARPVIGVDPLEDRRAPSPSG